MRVHNEKSGLEFEAWFESETGAPVAPPSVHWRLRNLTADEVVQDWSAVDYEIVFGTGGEIAGYRATIDVPGALNVLEDRANRRETFELMVVSDKDGDRELSETHEYAITYRGPR